MSNIVHSRLALGKQALLRTEPIGLAANMPKQGFDSPRLHARLRFPAPPLDSPLASPRPRPDCRPWGGRRGAPTAAPPALPPA